MPRHRALTALLLACVAFVGVSFVHGPGTVARDDAEQERSGTHGRRALDVVLVVIDDMGWEDLYAVSAPTLEQLAERGRTFTNFYVEPTCSPTRLSLMAGVHSSRDGVRSAIRSDAPNAIGLGADRPTVARVLNGHGWRTACFGKWHLNAAGAGREQESARRFGYEDWLAGTVGNIGIEGRDSQYEWERVDNGVSTTCRTYTAVAITEAFTGWWRENAGDRPRFATINYLTPHEPWSIPPGDLVPDRSAFRSNRRGRFEASIVALDALLGDVLAATDPTNTLVIVLADNGTPAETPPPDAHYRGYKSTCWQGGVHVPLIVLGPGVVPGLDESLGHAVDVPRTILDLCGVEVVRGFEDAVSLAPAVRGEERAPRPPVFVQYDNSDRSIAQGAKRTTSWAVIDANGSKLLRDGSSLRLFDLVGDPFELRPVRDPVTVERLRAVHDRIDP